MIRDRVLALLRQVADGTLDIEHALDRLARDTLVAAACSGDGAETEPTKFNHAEWLPLVKWSAEERIIDFDDGKPEPRVAM